MAKYNWFWHGAYVRSKSQGELIEALKSLVTSSTEGNLEPSTTSKSGTSVYHARGGVILFISPQESNWTAFWGLTDRFCWLAFEEFKLSGVLVGGEDNFQENLPNFWYLVTFEEGVVVDWYIYNLKEYFSNWISLTIDRLVSPYVYQKISASLDDDFEISKVLLYQNAVWFQGEFSTTFLQDYLKASHHEITDWQALRPIEALYQLPQIFDIPFIGTDYNIDDIAAYFDRQAGFKLSNQDYLGYEAAKKLNKIDEIREIPLRSLPGTTLNTIFNTYWDKFSFA